jgi:hypothetical protein
MLRRSLDNLQNLWLRLSPLLIFIFWMLWIPQNTA